MTATVLVLAGAEVAATAQGLNGGPPPVGGGGGGGSQSSGGGGTQSGSGSAGTEQVRSCFLYASSSSYGLTCVSGGSIGKAVTVNDILGDQFTDALCWDTVISPADLASKYGIQTDPTVTIPSYVHTCITGLVANNSLDNQPTAQINQTIYEIAKPCAAPPPYQTDQAGQCVMTLTAAQQRIADALDNQGGQIPGVVLSRSPAAQVRTNQLVTYQDAPLNPDGTPVTQTAPFTAQGVTIYATRTAFKIYPYGPGTTAITCSGASQAAASGDPCEWPYPQSSADQPNQAYPFRAEADWTVWVNDGTGARPWKYFQKYDDVQLPVYDVQTLVVGN